MKKIRIVLLVLLIITNTISFTGCWNYREIEALAIVAGVAVDKGINGKYQLTVEVLRIGGGKEAKTTSRIVTMEGKTMFDTVRNHISVMGKRLYWSHCKVIILSKEIACEGVTKALDWYSRDSETRADIHILISTEETAKEIFTGQETAEDIKSFTLERAINNQTSLSKAPETDLILFGNELKAQGISAVIPTVNLRESDGRKLPHVLGSAFLKKDKLVGFLNGDETKYLAFIKDEVKAGVLNVGTEESDVTTPVTLEIFQSKTQVKPVVEGNDIKMDINIDTSTAIDEIDGGENLIEDEGRKRLELSAEKELKDRVEALIFKMQSEYGLDIFGFGTKLREDNTKVWDQVSSNWEETFKNLKVNVTAKVHIRNSALLSKPLEAGE